MKILVIGSGGREHALVWKLRHSTSVEQVYCVPGNAGIAMEASCIPGDVLAPSELACLAETVDATLTVVGPEAPLVDGLVDEFERRGRTVLGPTRLAAQLEGSKIFAKRFLERHNIPTARYAVLEAATDIAATIAKFGLPVALKADGLAAGKGVVIAEDPEAARRTAAAMLDGQLVGAAGERVVVEEFLEGPEASFILLTDGRDYLPFPPTRDHKRALDGDRGPNTGGMGAYCSSGILSQAEYKTVVETIIEPTLAGMRELGHPFRGFLYCGLILTSDGPKVLEFNVRMGDPETQPLLYRLDNQDFAEVLLAAAKGRLGSAQFSWKQQSTVCVVLTSGGYPGPFEKGFPITGLADAEAMGVKVFHAGTMLRGGRPVTSGGRVLGVTGAADSLADAVKRTYSAVERIRFEGCHYRHDIGKKIVESVT
jgi:phosphoribosylamine--glycine ligase